jgi:hypothetical protein
LLSVKHDIDAFESQLTDFARRQLPFAAALALNDTAAQVKTATERGLERDFDRPTAFTRRSLYLRRASKARLEAEVGAKSIQAGYLKYQVAGGVRRPRGRAIVVPVNQRRNAYGNMPKGAVRRALSSGRAFSGRAGKTAGVFQRPSKAASRRGHGRLKLLVAYESKVRYRPRLRFYDTANKSARGAFRPAFLRRLQEALRTAR